MRLVAAVSGLALLIVGGCNLSVVQPEEELYQATLGEKSAEPTAPEAEAAPPEPAPYYLALPLSGPRYRHANVYGTGPILPAGTRVFVDRLERGAVTGTIPPQWYDWYPQTIAHIRRVYRIYFHTEEAACADGCEAHWRAADDDDFGRRFGEIFQTQDPLASVDEETRDLVKAHKVASWFDAATVRLSIGAPNAIVESGETQRWVFEERYCQGLYLIAEPALALEFQGESVETFERLSATDFYYPLEPMDPQAGLCQMGRTFEPFYVVGPDGFAATALEHQLGQWGSAPEPHQVADIEYWSATHWSTRFQRYLGSGVPRGGIGFAPAGPGLAQ